MSEKTTAMRVHIYNLYKLLCGNLGTGCWEFGSRQTGDKRLLTNAYLLHSKDGSSLNISLLPVGLHDALKA